MAISIWRYFINISYFIFLHKAEHRSVDEVLSYGESFSPVQTPDRLPAALSSRARVRLSGVSAGRGVPPPPTPPPPPTHSVMRLASELCSSLDRDGLRTSPEPEPGTDTRLGPVAEGQEGGSSLSGLRGDNGLKVKRLYNKDATID